MNWARRLPIGTPAAGKETREGRDSKFHRRRAGASKRGGVGVRV